MLVNCDVRSLEVVTAAQLSGDKVLCQEILDKEDIHENNRKIFNLGGAEYYVGETKAEEDARKKGRLLSKIFKFRLIYGGSAYSYAHDPEFMAVSREQDFWQNVIDTYYTKYYGIGSWHKRLIYEAQSSGRLVIPSGRYYPITPDYTKREPWPLTVIKNYPVQGFGADLVMLARLRANQLIEQSKIVCCLVCTVHDSIVADCPSRYTQEVGRILKQAVEDVPGLVKQTWNYNFVLPLTAEVKVGHNKADLELLDI